MEEINVNSLRPETLDEFIGQEEIINNLRVFIKASLVRKEILDHCLLYGAAGLGKTTLAKIISNETGGNFKEISGPTIERPGDLAAVLSNLGPGDCLFIDEIHRINKSAEELLYSAMEDFKINVLIGDETQSRNITIDLPPFVLIGATTKAGMLSKPLRDRFGITLKFEQYSIESLVKIVERTCKILEINIEKDASELIANCSRSTPRIVNVILKRIRDFLTIENTNNLNKEQALKYLEKLGINSIGLNKEDRNYISILNSKFNGGPIGINLLSFTLNESVETIEEVIEPYLINLGLIDRTPKGRKLTNKCFDLINQRLI